MNKRILDFYVRRAIVGVPGDGINRAALGFLQVT